MDNLELVKKTLNDFIRTEIYYHSIWELNSRAYNGLMNDADSYECILLKDFDSFTADMTQGMFFSVWKIFSNLKLKDLFFTNKDTHQGEAVEITMPSFLFYQLNTTPWFFQNKDMEQTFTRILNIDEKNIPDIIKQWISASDENKLIWDLMHYDLAKKEDFQKLLRFRNNSTLNPELFNLLSEKYCI